MNRVSVKSAEAVGKCVSDCLFAAVRIATMFRKRGRLFTRRSCVFLGRTTMLFRTTVV